MARGPPAAACRAPATPRSPRSSPRRSGPPGGARGSPTAGWRQRADRPVRPRRAVDGDRRPRSGAHARSSRDSSNRSRKDQDMSLDADREVIERYYRAMEAGSPDQMTTIFTEDAVYLEPFSRGGSATTHTGRPEIVGWLGASFETANRGVTITLDRIDVDGDEG